LKQKDKRLQNITKINSFRICILLVTVLAAEFVGLRNAHRKIYSELKLEKLKEREHLKEKDIDDSILLKLIYMWCQNVG
jgi:hypothetical protein